MSALHIGILAGETSGDILGAGLMQELRKRRPSIRFSGIGGPLMEAQGLVSRVPMERLSVMGLVEPLKRLPDLLRIRADSVRHFLADRPDVFVGIDSPDFNLGVERRLRVQGIRTVHYVSPSVWAWRQRRVRTVAAAADLVLALFPFEAAFYQKHDVPVSFVGHPLADTIPIESQRDAARRELNIPQGQAVVALLPGSRQGEVARMGPVFLQSAGLLSRERPDLRFLLPCANAERKRQLLRMQAEAGIRVDLLDGNSRLAMAAADAVLLASGTAALEALLLKKPMLVCYRMAPLSYAIISRMLRVPYFSLPNLLAGQVLVEELVQDAVNSPALAARMAALLDQDAEVRNRLNEAYLSIHASLRRGASARAADAVLGLTASV